ncbi:MAG: hypothetical protein RL281_1081 [Pseudomonadota bacterium]
MQKSTDFKAVFLYGLTIFLSAFLLFQVQPMMGKMILPWFGGSASVWTTCISLHALGGQPLDAFEAEPSSHGLAGHLCTAAPHHAK